MNPLREDLQDALDRSAGVWGEYRSASIFITGGTGFFGRWFLHTLAGANRAFGLGASCTVLTRDAAAFRSRNPQFDGESWLTLIEGDVRSFEDPDAHFSHIIHAATPASASFNRDHPREMFDMIIGGTERVLSFASRRGARKLLLCSSGAVYGRLPLDLDRVPEDFSGAPDPLHIEAAYGEGKRAAELLSTIEARGSAHLEVKIARCFAFVGPYLPLDTHFAIGNFIRDAMAGSRVVIRGDGTPLRSYLYAADLMIWLWTILARGASGRAYNVGSENAVSIAELARTVTDVIAPGTPVQILGVPVAGRQPERYVPSTARAREELGLREWIGLPESIRRTVAWLRCGAVG
jgi:dTDP-glucose 4,6-dehydratase